MKLLNKSIALTVTFCLLSQTALVAAPTTPDTTSERVSLHEVQAQAQQDFASLEKVEDRLITVTPFVISLAGAFCLLVKSWIKNVRLKMDTRALLGELSDMQKELFDLQKQFDGQKTNYETAQKEIQNLRKQNEWLQMQSRGRERGRQLAKEELGRQKVFNLQMEQAYKDEIAYLKESWEHTLTQTRTSLEMATKLDPFIEKDITAFLEKPETKKFLALDIRKVPANKGVEYFTHRENLASKILSEESWFQAMTKEEQAAFKHAFLEITQMPADILRNQSVTFVSFSFQKFMRKSTSVSGQYLSQLYRNVLTKQGVFGMAVLALGFSSLSAYADAQAQDLKMAQRIENNFKSFLKATPEQIRDIQENYPITYKTCVRSAAVIHELATMDPQELKENISSLRQEKALPTIRPTHAR